MSLSSSFWKDQPKETSPTEGNLCLEHSGSGQHHSPRSLSRHLEIQVCCSAGKRLYNCYDATFKAADSPKLRGPDKQEYINSGHSIIYFQCSVLSLDFLLGKKRVWLSTTMHTLIPLRSSQSSSGLTGFHCLHCGCRAASVSALLGDASPFSYCVLPSL